MIKLIKRIFGKERITSSAANYNPNQWGYDTFNGEQFNGSIGNPYDVEMDLESLRLRSLAASRMNPTAITVINRVLQTRLSSGLILKSSPKAKELGFDLKSLDEFSKSVESWFQTFAESKKLDLANKLTFAQIQKKILYRSFVDGDVLVINIIDPTDGRPRIQIIKAAKIQTPPQKATDSNIVAGVEYGKNGVEVAYYVKSYQTNKYRRIRANYKNGRFKARLIRYDNNYTYMGRGIPPTSPVINSIVGIDKYTASTISKKGIESRILGSIESETSTGAVSNKLGASNLIDTSQLDASKQGIEIDKPKPFRKLGEQVFLENLPAGSKIRTFGAETKDLGLDEFKDTVSNDIHTTLNIPPEAAKMAYNSNYSASQAANSDLKLISDIFIKDFSILDEIFRDFLVYLAASGYIDHSNMIVNSFQRGSVVFDLWSNCEWTKNNKNTASIEKQVKALDLAVSKNFMSHSQATEELSGIRASAVYEQQAKDHEELKALGLVKDEEELTK